MLRLGMIVLGVADMRRAVAFWEQALGYAVREGGADARWTVLTPVSGPGPELALQTSETPVQEHPRLHIDLLTGSAAEQAAEVERLVSLGAARADWDMYPDDPDFVVLTDPDDNAFCIVDTAHAPG